MAFSAADVIAQARSEVGYTESPRGSNRTKFAAEAGHANGQPWCATFCVAMARRCGGHFGNESAYTPSLFESMVHVGDPQPGDLAFFDFPDSVHRIQHVGIVVGADRSTVTCCEGNTSAGAGGSQANGGGVFLRTRSRSLVAGFGRPNYTGSQTSGDDEMTADQSAKLDAVFGAVARLEKALNFNTGDGLDPNVEEWTPLGQRVENIEAAVARIEKRLG